MPNAQEVLEWMEWEKKRKATMTNEEWFCELSTEEKAKFILDIKEHCYYCGAKQIPDRERCPFRDGKCRNNLHEFVGWLKEKHND